MLANFVVQLTFPSKVGSSTNPPWELYVDGLATANRLRVGIILTNPEGHSFQTTIIFNFPTTNNEAEYEALTRGLEMSMAMGVKRLQTH